MIKKTSANSPAQEFSNAIDTTEFRALQNQFKSLITTLNSDIVRLRKTDGVVKVLGQNFDLSTRAAREKGRDLAITTRAQDTILEIKEPDQYILKAKNQRADIREIEIVVPTANNPKNKISFIVVSKKDGETISYTPSANTFIKKNSEENGPRTKITASEVTKID